MGELNQDQPEVNQAIGRSIELRADARGVLDLLADLNFDLANAPGEIRKLALDFSDLNPELVCFERGVASRAVLSVLLKPTQRLLDFAAAVRTGDFEKLLIE